MALNTSITTGGTNSHQTTSEDVNALGTDILTAGVIGTTTSTSGVAPMTGAFAVNAQGTPDATVAVSTGVIYTTATPTGGNSQKFRTKNTASANVTISANATGSTRYDWLYLKLDPDKLANPNSGSTDVATLVTSRSTSATTDNGTPPTYGTVLAVITVANGFSTITNGNIADKRAAATSGINSASSFFALYDFVESGCVWTADAAGSTLAASMTSGYVWISGSRLTVASVTARAFTASKDTYVDLSDNSDGTATFTYTEVSNNAASPALSAGRVRIGIIVSGASSIAASTSINQGQETRVLPIASSIAYSVTDSLGNLICPRDPSRKLLGQRMITSNVTITTPTTSAAITGLTVPVVVPTGRKVKISVYCFQLANSGANAVAMGFCLTSAADANRLQQGNLNTTSGGTGGSPLYCDIVYTPSTSSVTFVAHVQASSGNATVNALGIVPAYIKVELE